MVKIDGTDHKLWQDMMKSVAQEICKEPKGNYVLKGGTGLLFGHGLDRHSTDLDFDVRKKTDIVDAIKRGIASD